ncbi:DUF397 domain-containing protein [Streptomyces sp. NPDC057702]|uniref:DUF397 domain-containing protein n=1 Tax=unclassified Streptomyces TaxID=2593676 RepID=UPI00369D6685
MTTPSPHWFTSSYSDNGGQCVEVATNLTPHDTIPVRDSKNPNGPTLTFNTSAWTAFITGAKAGDFDRSTQ